MSKPIRTPDVWAAQTRTLPATSSSEPGPFRPERTPYMIPIQRAATNPLVRIISVICASQMAKTESLFNVIGACLDDDPGPVLYVAPTREVVETTIEPRLMDMLRSSPDLAAGLKEGKANKKTSKLINGTQCRLAWAGSASQLASQPVQLAVMDEIDRMSFDVEGEGSPIQLVKARLRTYPNSKLILTSTPLIGNVTEEHNDETGLTHWGVASPEDVSSTIWRSWQTGTRFEWSWPCPDCSEYFIPRFNLLRWPKKATPAQARKLARVICPHCGVEIEDRFKTSMNRNGRYVDDAGYVLEEDEYDGPYNDHWSFWVSGLCSPWVPWGQCAEEFLTATRSGDTANVQGVINTVFGELFRTGGAAPPWQEVKALGGGYLMGEFPAGPLALTCGVDVQADRLVYAVRGWSYNMESWLIRKGELFGATDNVQVWDLLADLMVEKFGNGMTIRTMAIDSGYRPGDKFTRPDHMVYKFCRRFPGYAVPTKGHDMLSKPLHSSLIDVQVDGKIIKRGLQLWHLDSNYFKTFVHSKLGQDIASAGSWHIPSDIDDDYCQQITSEAKAILPSGKVHWIRVRKENHLLDCEALNVAAAHMLNAPNWRTRNTKAKTADDIAPSAATAPVPSVSGAPSPTPARRQQAAPRASWITGWRP